VNEVVREFLLETHENLAQLDLDLVTLEKVPGEKDTVARVFRTLHTVKGTAGFLGLEKLQGVAHASENLLSKVRSGELTFGPAIASAMLATVDAVRGIIAAIENEQTEGTADHSSLITRLEALTRGEADPAASSSGGHGSLESEIDPSSAQRPPTQPSPSGGEGSDGASPRANDSATGSFASLDPKALSSGDSSATIDFQPPPAAEPSATKKPRKPRAKPAAVTEPEALEAAGRQPSEVGQASKPALGSSSPAVQASEPPPYPPPESEELRGQASDSGRVSTGAPGPAASPAAAVDTPPSGVQPSVADSAIRVDVGLLDKLMNVVGELVLARNQLVQHTQLSDDAALLGTVQRLNLLTTELQAGVMKTRMQPIGNVWSKFPRLVRDLSVACGKKVRFEMEGQETELDKTILEAIRDPLTHMVRNAVDHGIELPAARLGAGKGDEGRLRLSAYHEGGKVVIEIVDDGGGIDPARVRDKAVRQGLVSHDQAGRMSEREVLELIFRPGFSTAEKVTQFSGRGVGMDVVRTNIERIGGSVDLESRLGAGTAVRMKIPLTLAIVPALTVSAAGERFAIPQVSLLELVRLEGESATRGIEMIGGAPVHRLRGTLLPLVRLDRELGLVDAVTPRDTTLFVVLQADDRQFGLIVDGIHDTEEIVVKPLERQLKGLSVYSGATIMGDGRVALILDVLGLAQRAGVITAGREKARADVGERTRDAGSDEAKVSALLFAGPDGGRLAIPLSQLARLEEFPASALERLGDRLVVQYRGDILPLVPIDRLVGGDPAAERAGVMPLSPSGDPGQTVPVVVHSADGRSVGVIVGEILDIVQDEALGARRPALRPGVAWSAVVRGRVTEFIDLRESLSRVGVEEVGDG
jgi:two-component system chemotaxis sensor kinase CheA